MVRKFKRAAMRRKYGFSSLNALRNARASRRRSLLEMLLGS